MSPEKSPFSDDGGEGIAQLQRLDKTASIGTLAASIAHDINSPLAVLAGNIGLLREAVETGITPDLLKTFIEKMERSVTRLTHISSGLRNVARSTEVEAEVIDIHVPITETVGFMQKMLAKAGVTIELALQAQDPRGLANWGRLQLVIMNLLTNSCDALSGCSGEKRIWISTVDEKEGLVLRVRDNGRGLSPDQSEKIFEPFFTTQPAGAGIGLGLAMARFVLRSFGASVSVQSEAAKGTEFIIQFRRSA